MLSSHAYSERRVHGRMLLAETWQARLSGGGRGDIGWLRGAARGHLAGASEDGRVAAENAHEADGLANEMVEVGDMVFLVGRVEVVVGQAGAHENDWHVQDAIEEGTNGDGPAGALEDGRSAPLLFKRLLSGAHVDIVQRDEHGVAAVDQLDIHANTGRAQLRDALLQQRQDISGTQPRRETQADLGVRLGGDDGLGALTDETATNAVNLQRGAGRLALTRVVLLLAGEDIHAHLFFHDGDDIYRAALPECTLFGGDGGDLLVELRDRDVAVGAFELGEDERKGMNGIWADAAVLAGVQIVLRAIGVDLGVDDAAQAVDEGGHTRRRHAGIGDEGDVAGELLGVVLDVRLNGFAAGLFFTLDEHTDVDGKSAVAGAHERFEGLDDAVHLAFIVYGAARVDIVVAHSWLKRVALPQLNGIYRLDIVVAIHEHGGSVWRFQPFAVNERMAARLDDPDVFKAQMLKLARDVFRGTLDVVFVLGQRADARDTQQRFETVEELIAVRLGVGKRRLGGICRAGHGVLSSFRAPSRDRKGRRRTSGFVQTMLSS